ncbi:LppP/LprE family lipoprotein [Mycobacterium marinum]|uniref:LppP/LprE family lipoprotein n=1 Tax=Mycobacterium marinum TaxID=1781 RepID=UPI0023593A1A|nr:LppP/LprE family lipoprotein [Mycobacterium marinum]MDC8973046.1 LppP/LprE family lipoprotein [Mycobacterium marinum]
MASGEIDPNWPPPVYQPSDNVDTTPPSSQPGVRGGSGRVIWLVVALVAAVCVGVVAIIAYSARRQPAASPPATTAATARATTSATTPVATSPTSAPPGSCGPDEAAAVAAALATLPPDKKTGRPWNPTPEFSDYDPCAELSAVVVTVVDATRSSPDEALMFHRGQFVGTATPEAYPFTQLEAPASTDDLVVLTYRSRQSCDACEDGVLTVVGFQWQGDHVQMLDPPPEPWDSPP